MRTFGCLKFETLRVVVSEVSSPDERSDIRGGVRVIPDVAALIRATGQRLFEN